MNSQKDSTKYDVNIQDAWRFGKMYLFWAYILRKLKNDKH